MAYIKHISYYLPEKVVTNEELVKEFPEWSVDKVTKKVGVNARHIASEKETAGDMAEKAARKLFEEYRISPSEIDFVLLCTQSPDYFLPTTACILQHKLGIPTEAGAFDYNLGCSGCIYGLAIAKGFIEAGIAQNILLITSETYSKYLHPLDKSNRSIFGDGAAACLISTDGFAKIGDFVFGTDGSGANNLIVKTGGARNKNKTGAYIIDDESHTWYDDYLYMNGGEIFNFTLNKVPALIDAVLVKNKLMKSEIDYFVFHQANKFMLNTIRSFSSGTRIICHDSIEFAENVRISWDCTFVDTDFHGLIDLVNGKKLRKTKPITIGYGAWIGHNSIVSKGVKIPDKCIVSSGAVVKSSFKGENIFIAGNPAIKLDEGYCRDDIKK